MSDYGLYAGSFGVGVLYIGMKSHIFTRIKNQATNSDTSDCTLRSALVLR